MSRKEKQRTGAFVQGLRDGVPIALGYFAVSFSLGIAARNAGLTVVQGMIASVLCMASAGQYALFTLMGAAASLWEVAVVSFITNARYFLMSCALSQKIDPAMKNYHRFIFGGCVTDEIFGISIARPGYLDPWYNYGAMAVSIPGWSVGTGLGILMGNLLPGRIVSALSVALYGMFLAIIIPPAKKDRVVAGCVVLSFAASYAFDVIPRLAAISAGTRTILLTVVISALAAALFPRKEAAEDGQ